MENPAISLFQGAEINLNNSQNNVEEEEDFEEQKRRNEELQKLLTAKLDDFNYEESTVNSSTNISIISADEAEKKYKDALDPSEQLKVLYDVRVREIETLREELEKVKIEKCRETDELKNKVFVKEAELQQLRVSLKNSEILLVEKTSQINELNKNLDLNGSKCKKLEEMIENYQIDLNTYQITINELQMKLQTEPFNQGSKRFQSEEIQKAHQDQMAKIESLLEQKTKTVKIYEKEKMAYQAQLEKLINLQNDNEDVIKVLTKNFDGAQQQCRDLIDLIEKLSNENRHLTDRLNTNNGELHTSADGADASQIEKLRKMLLDKSVEIDVLNSKLKNYENNIRELLEYRDLKSDVYKKEFQQCDNKEHTRNMLLMQNDLQNYRRTIEDKNQQISILNSTNKDLLEKLEAMLSQTRNDIQSFSHKYNLPQLEKMTGDLKKAEEKIIELEQKLQKSEEKRSSLNQKLQKNSKSLEKEIRKDLEVQINNLQLQSEKDKHTFENQLIKLHNELEISAAEIKNLKSYIEELIEENAKLKQDLNTKADTHTVDRCGKTNTEEELLKKQYLESVQSLHECYNRIKTLEETIQELGSAKTMIEGEKFTFEYQLRECELRMEKMQEIMQKLEDEVSELTKTMEEKNELINQLFLKEKDLEEVRKDLKLNENTLKINEENKRELVELLDKTNGELVEAKKEILRLQKQLAETNEKIIRSNLEIELKGSKNDLDLTKEEDREALDLLRIELKVREEMQKEYSQKLAEIEKNYQKSSTSSKSLHREQAGKLKNLETKHRDQMALILKECAQKLKILEDDRDELVTKIRVLHKEYENCRKQLTVSEEACNKMITEIQLSAQRNEKEWKKWSKKFVGNCLKIAASNQKTSERVLDKMNSFDREVAAIERSYIDKIKKCIKN